MFLFIEVNNLYFVCVIILVFNYWFFPSLVQGIHGSIGAFLVMWVDFWMFSFKVTLLLKIENLEINGEDLRKIPTGHELNQVVK